MELGSEFNLNVDDLNIVENNLFKKMENYHYQLFDTGRSAIKCIANENDKKILVPEFICESVIDCFSKEKIVFYKIDENMHIDYTDLLNKMTSDVGLLLIVHYFGLVHSKDRLNDVRKKAQSEKIIIVEDTTQSFFSENDFIGDYMVASLRKWMPIPNGGILFSTKTFNKKEYEKSSDNERINAMILKTLFLDNKLDCNSEYRTLFGECEKRIDDSLEIKEISDFSRFIISCIDIQKLVLKRQENYFFLKKQLEKMGINPVCFLEKTDCPFVLPIRVKSRNEFRSYLMDNRIYCAVHWPFDGYRSSERLMGKHNADTLISLPIDQRYGINDMKYLVDVIANYKGEI